MKAKFLITVFLLTGIGISATAQIFENNLKVVIKKADGSAITEEKFDQGTVELTFDGATIIPQTCAKTTVEFEVLENITFQDVYNDNFVGVNEIKVPILKAYMLQGSNTLMIENDKPIGSIVIVSLTGKTLVKTFSIGMSANVDVSRLPQGIFILKAGGNTLKFYK